jgi:hypothetical protein
MDPIQKKGLIQGDALHAKSVLIVEDDKWLMQNLARVMGASDLK